MGHYENGAWTSDTGLAVPVLAVDCDGTLNNKPEGQTGVDNGATWNFALIRYAVKLGCRVGIMTCNDPFYVAGVLEEHGIPAVADLAREYKIPPWDDAVLVTDRKILADWYIDDRNALFRYGDSVPGLFARIGLDRDGDGRLDYDYKTPEYKSYVQAWQAFIAGDIDQAALDEVCHAAAAAAAAYGATPHFVPVSVAHTDDGRPVGVVSS